MGPHTASSAAAILLKLCSEERLLRIGPQSRLSPLN